MVEPTMHDGWRMDHDKIERGVRLMLAGMGEDPDREGLRETPARVARALEESCAGLCQDPALLFEKSFDVGCHEMVIVRDIPFYSLCEHHLLPFFGVAHVAYLPGEDGRVCGISKLARVVDVFAKRPQVQEQLTRQVADAVMEGVGASGVLVVMEAEHLCMTMRGVRKPGAKTTTSAVRGAFERHDATRAEAMSLIFNGTK
ncbi:GTP cyclohydrolase I [Olsenella uli DSM 7084]|uniref:GTP cyclohydrolase 1 n=1 Tax=Olsenella uli (strain ATCC 49627 / DSM 7084 / CCUG 31166 / CIP 109912 / JCM 12494 / LMG 11480 / NCIMB 702895 / VPI D76D-27C) TaxID=633147 RepID=E1QXW8_OLSUV|nr:GTP cyclohydrolase I FolE [Olsenella uli]ADK67232.1 GTP cyclohydrolase I [Olsenella uli DSM 7084]EUB30870.1 GTP cyclohydrolase I [Olsenella uli MSTE5]KRO12456.1 GTP cyclohydrolase I [Olsenella uli DSM 7084]